MKSLLIVFLIILCINFYKVESVVYNYDFLNTSIASPSYTASDQGVNVTLTGGSLLHTIFPVGVTDSSGVMDIDLTGFSALSPTLVTLVIGNPTSLNHYGIFYGQYPFSVDDELMPDINVENNQAWSFSPLSFSIGFPHIIFKTTVNGYDEYAGLVSLSIVADAAIAAPEPSLYMSLVSLLLGIGLFKFRSHVRSLNP